MRSGPLESQQFDLGLLAIARTANDADEFIQVRQGAEVAFENLGAFLGLLQLKARPAQNNLAPMLDIALDKLLQVQRLGPPVIDGEAIHGEADFQLRVLVEVVDDDLGNRVALEFHDEPAGFIRLVAHGGNVGDDLLVDEIGDLLFQRGAIHVERNFRDHELFARTLHLLDADPAAQLQTATAGIEVVLNAFDAADHAAGREVGPFDEFHQIRNGDGRVVNLGANAVDDFTQIMRRHVRGHADGDAGAAIDQEIRKRRGQDCRFSEAFVVIRHELHRVLVHVEHQRRAQLS